MLLAAAVVTVGAWWWGLIQVSSWAVDNNFADYHLFLEHLAGVFFLLIVVVPYQKWIATLGVGHVLHRNSVLPSVAVLVVYLSDYWYSKYTNLPPESWVVDLLNQPYLQLLSVFFTILVLAPISEEILFRGILLNIFFESRVWVFWAGVVLMAIIFSAIHPQYQHVNTFLQLMALSAIFSWARLRSGGLMLPILLHSLASLLAVFFTWLY
ncbi:CPBP family intramembrane glutamic endopeptidase [Aeromonas dhakensis]|uniref:CPBP family intramembrane glutamic endopeptidase n=1 Tax=Aeromonas dhakensis TaxID=196024 RepID=UPI001B38E108|nr:CPBP family intramembrane glutamic endopeptidase [Aeromonas dhakensis]